MLNLAAEQKLVTDSGHETGCWEWWVEDLIEEVPALEGRHDEIHPVSQMTLMDLFYAETQRETWAIGECNCQDPA